MHVFECIAAFAAENFTGIRLPHRTTKRDDLFYNSYCNKEIKLQYFFRDLRGLFKRDRSQVAPPADLIVLVQCRYGQTAGVGR